MNQEMISLKEEQQLRLNVRPKKGLGFTCGRSPGPQDVPDDVWKLKTQAYSSSTPLQS